MSLKTGIVGLPNVGKARATDIATAHRGARQALTASRVQSTLFNALVENGKAQAANFPFCTVRGSPRSLQRRCGR